jgi:hypothetical protein
LSEILIVQATIDTAAKIKVLGLASRMTLQKDLCHLQCQLEAGALMAKISSNVGLDMTKLYFYEVTAGAYNSSYSNNAYVSYNNITYEDVVEVDWVAGSNIYASLFGGYSITLSSAGAINGGTGTGYLLLSWTGATTLPSFALHYLAPIL